MMTRGSSHETKKDGPVMVKIGSRAVTQECCGAAQILRLPPRAASIAGVIP